MLCGVGGATVAQAKAAMTVTEAQKWLAYRRKRGTLNLGLRMEEGIANLLFTLHSALGQKPTSPDKFMPHVVGKSPADDDEPDIEQVFHLLKTVAASNNAADTPGQPPKTKGK